MCSRLARFGSENVVAATHDSDEVSQDGVTHQAAGADQDRKDRKTEKHGQNRRYGWPDSDGNQRSRSNHAQPGSRDCDNRKPFWCGPRPTLVLVESFKG